MSTNKHFAIESLETRNESFWILVPYFAWCVRYVWGFPIYYPCVKYRWVWI